MSSEADRIELLVDNNLEAHSFTHLCTDTLQPHLKALILQTETASGLLKDAGSPRLTAVAPPEGKNLNDTVCSFKILKTRRLIKAEGVCRWAGMGGGGHEVMRGVLIGADTP